MKDTEYKETDEVGVGLFYDEKIKENGIEAFLDGPLYREVLDKVIGCKTLLDAGCGVGNFIVEAKERGIDAVGVDVSSEAIKLAGKRGLSVMRATMSILPFEDREYEAVVAIGSLEHTNDVNKAFQELKRVASKKVVIVVPIWLEGISEMYKNEKLKNIERWLPVEEWKEILGPAEYSFVSGGRDLLAVINVESSDV